MKYKSIILFLSVFAISFSACKENKPADTEAAGEAHHDEHENDNTVTLSAKQMESINIQLGIVEKKQLTASLKANGILKVPNQNRASITAIYGGTIKTILVQPGNTVRKGEVIATIANPSIITMQEEFLDFSSKAELAQLEYARQKELNSGNAGSLKSLQQSESELKSLKAKKAGLEKQLELLGIDPSKLTSENIQSIVSITSPISGSVSNVMVNIGSYIQANNPIAEIVDNSQLHLDLYVYEKDLGKLKVGQTIHFTLTNNQGREYDAKVYGVSNTFEENTKAIAVHAQVEGDKTGLIDGMSITALVSLEKAEVDAVPTEAIVSYQGQDYIFVATDEHAEDEHHEESDGDKHDGHGHKHHGAEKKETVTAGNVTFERIPVRKGTSEVGYSEVTLLKDVPADTKVVTSGAFFVLAKMTNSGGGHSH
jgi:cobalt-zinc-cadmium efflux system membrane fusion protein